MSEITEKQCSGPNSCGLVKSISEFGIQKSAPDGYRYKCKTCTAVDGAIYRKNNFDKISTSNKKKYRVKYHDPVHGHKNMIKRREYEAEYRKNNPDIIVKSRLRNKEKAAIQASRYRKINAEKIQIRQTKYYLNNKESILNKTSNYQKANKSAYVAYSAKHYKNNKKAHDARTAQWYKDNPDKMLAKNAKRRAAKMNRTPAWANLNAVNQVYADCVEINIAARLTGCTEKFVVDHIIPLLGTNVSGFHIASNLQIITAKANSEKSNKFTPG